MSRGKYFPPYAAGVLVQDSYGMILAVTRQPPMRYRKQPHSRYDWGLPGGKANPGEYPYQTAVRELYEETGVTCPYGVAPLLEVPADPLNGRMWPFYVFVPIGKTAGDFRKSGPDGMAAWVAPSQLLEVREPAYSVAESNRYILYWGLGIA